MLWCDYFAETYIKAEVKLNQATLVKYLPLCSGRYRNILDIGGGVGIAGHSFVDFDAMVITMNGRFQKSLTDPYVPFQEFISEKGVGLHLTHNALSFPYPFASRSFDLVFNKAFIAFIEKEDWNGLFTEWNRLLRPGGIVVFFHIFQGDEKRNLDTLLDSTNKLWWKPIALEPRYAIFVTPTSNEETRP